MLIHAHRRKGAPTLGATRRGQVGPFGPYGATGHDDHDAAPPLLDGFAGGQDGVAASLRRVQTPPLRETISHPEAPMATGSR
ncbi:hypothetical protein Psi01_83410 [Planobispora siamensis]|uniref:Uncharacterized protein n=1 Tax=Planobispora siamensis TaxID=936338 RepID=A0A8J3WSA6_9ACTN|nr:hypothetical protein Psi01_83410 [Planobispora siamensis]